jgi:hypothetical protein
MHTKVLIVKPEGKRPRGKPTHRSEINLKMYPKEMEPG